MKHPPDSKIGWQMVKRNHEKRTILTTGKDYDWWLLRQKLRLEVGIPEIKHREFGSLGVSNNHL
jgi:hypothetical protein